jgi:hypothetical protein
MPTSGMHARSLTALLAALAALAAVTVALAGCGSSGSSLDPVAQAAETTTHAAGFQMEFTGQVTVPGLPSPVALKGTGFFNPGSHEGSLTMDISGVPLAAAGGGLSMHELFKSTNAYIGSSLFAGKLPGGARWMKLNLARAGQALGINVQSLTSGGTNPAQFLEFLKGSAGSVTKVGQEPVRGVQTTRYRATVDLSKVADAAPSAERDAVRQALSKLTAQTGLHTLPVEVWVDAHNMARRIALTMSLTVQGQSIQFAFSLDLFHFGPTPAVQVPAASETYEPNLASLVPAG